MSSLSTPPQLLRFFPAWTPEELSEKYPLYPLDAPGMPPPGPDFLAEAVRLGDQIPNSDWKKDQLVKYLADRDRSDLTTEEVTKVLKKETKANLFPKAIALAYPGSWLETMYRAALYKTDFHLTLDTMDGPKPATFIPGHLWSPEHIGRGPEPARVMVVGKHPGREEFEIGANFVGQTSQELLRALDEIGVTDEEMNGWYVTNVLKHLNVERLKDTVPASWIKNGLPLLHQELCLVKPDFVLCLGAEASKAVLGRNVKMSDTVGRVYEQTIQVKAHPGSNEYVDHPIKIVCCAHPARVARDPELYDKPDFMGALKLFTDLSRGAGLAEEVLEKRYIRDLVELQYLVGDVIRETQDGAAIALDCEWHGDYPWEPGSYLRTIQFSHREKFGAAVILHEQGGKRNTHLTQAEVAYELGRMLKPTPERPVRIIGHNLKADLPWLLSIGLDLRDQFLPPLDDPDPDGVTRLFGWQKTATEGGFDTMYAAHAYSETGALKLEALGAQHLGVPRYDVPIQEWKKAYCKQQKIKEAQLDGYGEVPEDILLPYSVQDASVTRRLFELFNGTPEKIGLLDYDRYGNCCREAFWITQGTALPFLEMEMTGLLVDTERTEHLIEVFQKAKDGMLEDLRSKICWNTFNPESSIQRLELLFGEEFNGKKTEDGQIVSVRPEGAVSLGLTPIATTDGKPWKQAGPGSRPAGDKETLGILAQQSEEVKMLRDLRFISQTLKTVLRPGTIAHGEDGEDEKVYEKGLMAYVGSDKRVRSHFYPVETGRVSSSSYNLQNQSSRRDADYARLLKEDFTYGMRSVFVASPGHVLIEADYTGAELAAMAWQSGDPQMIEHCRRNMLPENHPDYYDIHSNVAVQSFGLSCEPTKKGLKSIGKAHLRVAAKCVAAGSRLLTERGMVLVDELAAGLRPGQSTEICSATKVYADQDPTPVVGAYNGGTKRCLKVTTQSGYELTSTRNHKYRVINDRGNYVWRRADKLRVGDWVCVRRAFGPFGKKIDFPKIDTIRRTRFKSIDFPEAFNEDWAAFLGLYIAEGYANPVTGMVQINVADEVDPEFAHKISGLMRRLFGTRCRQTGVPARNPKHQHQQSFCVTSVELARWLYAFTPGKAPQKHIPAFVFEWPAYLQAALLSWMFEGDGTAKKDGSIVYGTSSEVMAREIQLLLLNFGVLSTRASEWRKPPYHTFWTVSISEASRNKFCSHIGFITKAKGTRCFADDAVFHTDRRQVPHQIPHLKKVFPYLTYTPLEKCRECLRTNKRVKLNRSRLQLILEAIRPDEVKKGHRASFKHLQKLLDLPVYFQKVKAIEDVGKLQVYDVQTTGDHTVAYNGLITHQTLAFGRVYGQGPDAAIRRIKEEGSVVSLDQVKQLMSGMSAMYPRLDHYLNASKDRVSDPGWMVNAFGRYRRFGTGFRDRDKVAELERQAMNFGIQSLIADAMSRALDNLYRYRIEHPDVSYRIILQVHDSVMLEVPIEHAVRVYEEVIPECLSRRVPIYPATLEGVPRGDGPYYLGVDRKLVLRWGEGLGKDEARSLGIPEQYAS